MCQQGGGSVGQDNRSEIHSKNDQGNAWIISIDAAKAIGISVDTLSNYERGKSYPDIPVLRKIEKTYNIKYNQLIFLPLDYGLTVDD